MFGIVSSKIVLVMEIVSRMASVNPGKSFADSINSSLSFPHCTLRPLKELAGAMRHEACVERALPEGGPGHDIRDRDVGLFLRILRDGSEGIDENAE